MINESTRNDSLEGLLAELSDSILKRCEKSLPCVVVSVSANRQRVTVKPLIRIVSVDGTDTSRSVIEGLPVYQAGAGNLVMSFPVKAGDIGWIDTADRDISLFLQTYADSRPPTRRKHSFGDARFIPDMMTNFQIAGEDAAAVVIQDRAGTVKIALDAGQIRITNQAVSIVIDGSTVTGTAPGGFFLNGAQITPAGDFVTPTGASLESHFHTQGIDSDNDTQQNTSVTVPTE